MIPCRGIDTALPRCFDALIVGSVIVVYSINELCKLIGTYLQADQVEQVKKAYKFSASAHEGQHRVSGEPYIHHPLDVARTLAEMRMDHSTLMAAILHDVIEDTPRAKDEIRKKFGKGVAELVDGVSKLTHISFESYAQAQAHNFRKMLMAMSNDIRVILVKLADRLHNMRTLEVFAPGKRRRIARETLDVYAPISLRLGINSIRLELEELGFANLYPLRHRILAKRVEAARGNRKKIIQKIRAALKRRMRQEKIHGRILGREKHLYSIYRKMCDQHLKFSEVYDVYAFRIIVNDADTCYRTLGLVHNLYKPVPGKFKDYIAIPKTNGYQSLHTVLFGPFGVPIEIQIRTDDMEDVAEVGIAAHWLYKSADGGDRSGAHRRARVWLRNILEMQKMAGNPEEFFENVKIDLFPDAIYVFTPQGKIMELPGGATAVDFAYAIHTDVGNRCVGVRIDRKPAPLGTVLSSGQTVEIITMPDAHPKPAWINFVVTARARSNIRYCLKNLQQSEAIALGERLLHRELSAYSIDYRNVDDTLLQRLLENNHVENEKSLFQSIGLGDRMAPFVARELALMLNDDATAFKKKQPQQTSVPLFIQGTEGMVVNFPKCCYPIPGDEIYGFMSAGRGVVIHRRSCKNLHEYNNQPDKWIHVEWEDNIDREFKAAIKMNVSNQRGVLATIAAAIADRQANIDNLEMQDRDDRYITISFVVEVTDRRHLADVMRRLRRIKPVSHMSRQ